MDIKNISIEEIDIIAEMKTLTNHCREAAVETLSSQEKIDCYDLGVKHAMSALKTLIHSFDFDKEDYVEKNRLIYQKYGEQSWIQRYRSLYEVLQELYGGD